MSDSRRKREAQLRRRCLESSVPSSIEAVIEEATAIGAAKDKIEAPKVSLRSFFPETWLFTLEPVNEETNISR